MRLEIDREKCTACLKCVDKCPNNIFEINNKIPYIINREKCLGQGCGACVMVCHTKAIMSIIDNQVIWGKGRKINSPMGYIWEEEPLNLTIRSTFFHDYSYRFGKYNLEKLLQRKKSLLFLIKTEDGYLIDTEYYVNNIIAPPRPKWFSVAIVPVEPFLIEEQKYSCPDNWYYSIGIDLKIEKKYFPSVEKEYDVYIIHSSSDKEDFVRPLVYELKYNGVSVWYDESNMFFGEDIWDSMNKGIKSCKTGVIVISKNLIKEKKHAYLEITALLTRERDNKCKSLPIHYGVSPEEVSEFNIFLGSKSGISGEMNNVSTVAKKIAATIRN